METPQTWQDLLGKILKDSGERAWLAKTMKIPVLTLIRWSKNEELPARHQLLRLYEVVPPHHALLRLLLAEKLEAVSITAPETFSNSIPVTFYAHLLALAAATSDESRFWTLSTAVLSEALKHLDPEGLGLSLSVVQCMAPVYGKSARCLRERVRLVTSPEGEQMEEGMRFLGAESLAGEAVSTGSRHIVADMRQEQRLTDYLPEYAVGAAAFPLLYGNRIAGCLLAASTQRDYFRADTICDLLHSYAALLVLAFHPQDFYAQENIDLQTMPPLHVQEPYLSTLRQRILATVKTAFSAHHAVSYRKAEQYIWEEVSEELLHLS